ncbi:MAG: hypothetical protein LLG97_12380, partial [Deltaproteobacteria bacterium]|nr:hypothetical protein [Deltaproteobacteria bacterium]
MKVLVDPNLWDSKKLFRFGKRIGLSHIHAAGHLIKLWCWAVEHQIDGDLSGMSAEEIATFSGWSGNPDDFLTALTEEGWVVKGMINDWNDHQGKYIQKVLRDRARKLRGSAAEVPRRQSPPVAVAVAVPVAGPLK